jgi:hypothetical protein
VDVSETEEEVTGQATAEEKPKPRRGRPPGSRTKSSARSTSRLERRAGVIERTLEEVVQWAKVDFTDNSELSFLDTVKRDARRIGTGLAAIGERVNAFGKALDAIFGLTGPLAIFVALGPTVRAAYRDSREMFERRRQEKQRKAEAQREPDGEVLVEVVEPDRRDEWESDQVPPGLEAA